MLKLNQIRKVHVELTTKCNARCPMCPRNYRGLDYNSGYPVTELLLADIQHIFQPEFLKQLSHNEVGINFNGNLGDFALARDGVEIVKFFASNNVKISINTNGSLRPRSWWRELALPNVQIGFALDGLEDTHSLYRQDTDWNRVIENAKEYIAAGGNAVWRFIPFDHNQHQQQQCRELAAELGFANFEIIYDGRDCGPVFSRSGEFSHQIGHDPSGVIPNIKPLLESHITWYDAATIKHERDTEKLNINCWHVANREIYLAADGTVYPCCWLGFYPTQMSHPGNRELAKLVHENNALEYPLEHCLNWFDQVEKSWQHSSVAAGRTFQCISTCNRI